MYNVIQPTFTTPNLIVSTICFAWGLRFTNFYSPNFLVLQSFSLEKVLRISPLSYIEEKTDDGKKN